MLCSALPPPLAPPPLEAGEASEVRFGLPGAGGSEGGEGWGDEEAALDPPPPPPPPPAANPTPYEREPNPDPNPNPNTNPNTNLNPKTLH